MHHRWDRSILPAGKTITTALDDLPLNFHPAKTDSRVDISGLLRAVFSPGAMFAPWPAFVKRGVWPPFIITDHPRRDPFARVGKPAPHRINE